MVNTNKFLMYDLNAGGFVADNGSVKGNNIQDGAIFSEETAKRTVMSPDEESFLCVPMTRQFLDSVPFTLVDTAPDVPFSMDANNEALRSESFVVLNDAGFFKEEYSSQTNTSSPKVSDYELNHATLYSMDVLKEQGADWIIWPDGGTPGIIVPVSEVQQEKLRELPDFSPTTNSHGFFMKPIGDDRGIDMDDAPDLGEALAMMEVGRSQDNTL